MIGKKKNKFMLNIVLMDMKYGGVIIFQSVFTDGRWQTKALYNLK